MGATEIMGATGIILSGIIIVFAFGLMIHNVLRAMWREMDAAEHETEKYNRLAKDPDNIWITGEPDDFDPRH